MKAKVGRNWPLYAATVLLFFLVSLLVTISVQQNHGNFVYALDDAYIHLAMARNFSRWGVWGVTRWGYTPASSSLLWTLLLSLTFRLVGVSQFAPLAWNLVFAVAVLAVADHILRWYKASPAVRAATLIGIVLLVPLPTLILSGMEQTLQTLIEMLAVFLATRWISGESLATARRDAVLLLVLAPLVTAVRFEGMFLLAAVALLLLLFRRWLYAGLFLVCGFLPVIINAWISVAKGWFWFPTSVLLKATLPNRHTPWDFVISFLDFIFVAFRTAPHVLVLMVSILLLYILASHKGSGAGESRQLMGVILILTGLGHVAFVGGAPLFRYDACWCTLALLFVGLQVPLVLPHWPDWRSPATGISPSVVASGALVLLLAFMLGVKGVQLLWNLPQCTTNVYEQQYQMGLFVRRYYQGSSVALNDIGAVNFLADIHCVDLWGLANVEVARARDKRNYGAADIARLARENGARIAIIYDSWFPGVLPKEWVRVGRWTIPNNVIVGNSTVSLYATGPAEVDHLVQSLQDFYSRLPAEVTQQGH